MQHIDAFCRGLYTGFLKFGQVMIRPSGYVTLLAFVLWFATLFLAPNELLVAIALPLAGWFVGGKIRDLHTYLRNRFD